MKLTKTCLFLSAMTAMLIGMAGSAIAQTAKANIPVSASVASTCSISTPVAGISFGAYSPLSGTAGSAQTVITVTCTVGAGASIELNQGTNNNRTMSDGNGNSLAYELHKTSATGPTWGSTVAERMDSGPAPSLAARPFTVFGVIPPSQAVPGGSYSDIVEATVNF
jgi:spore coat protein U-like protein